MNDDFSNINLYISERFKLRFMKWFKHQVTESYFGPDTTRNILTIKFLTARYPFEDVVQSHKSSKALYSLTDRYGRYCVYRRRKFFDSSVWPAIVSGIVSIIVAVITTLVTTLVLVKTGLR